MKNRFYFSCFTLFCTLSLRGAAPQDWALQEMRLSLENVEYKIHGHQSELEILHEKMEKLEQEITKMKETPTLLLTEHSLEKKLVKLEHAHECIVQDLKKLKSHFNETATSLAQCQKKLDHLDKNITEDIKHLKSALQTMVALLQTSDKSTDQYYYVKSGDTLGQIAVDHQTDTKTIKQLNQMSNDTIFPGQKLLMPNNLSKK